MSVEPNDLSYLSPDSSTVAVLVAGIVWLVRELAKLQASVFTRIDQSDRLQQTMLEKVSGIYEKRLDHLTSVLSQVIEKIMPRSTESP